MGTLVRDGQSNVRRFFVRQGACSGLEVSENTDKSTVQKWSKMGLASPITMGPKRRNVHSTGLHGGRRNAKKGVKMEPKKPLNSVPNLSQTDHSSVPNGPQFCPKRTTVLPRYSNLFLNFEQFLKFPCCSFPNEEARWLEDDLKNGSLVGGR